MDRTLSSSTIKAFELLAIDKLSIIFSILIFLSASIVFAFNHYYWHYALLSYFFNHVLSIILVFTFCTSGCFFILGAQDRLTQKLTYLLVYFLILFLGMYATTAVQLTPFQPIDEYLVKADLVLHYNMQIAMHALYKYPIFVKCLYKVYNFLNYETLFVPILLILTGHFLSVKRYFFFVLSTLFLGFFMYYFLPTTAPASMVYSAHFLPEQYNTGRKFYELHHHIFPESGVGGLISMPSFHVIWAVLCQQSVWRIRWLWIVLLPINILIILAALLLGWHYLVDFIGSAFVLGVSWLLARVVSNTKKSALLAGERATHTNRSFY